MQIKTSELVGAALDYAVAKAAYPESVMLGDRLRVRGSIEGELCTIGSVWLGKQGSFTRTFEPSTDWNQAGRLIERYDMTIARAGDDAWGADAGTDQPIMYAPTPLIAAMRAIVAYELGDSVEIPDELVEKANGSR